MKKYFLSVLLLILTAGACYHSYTNLSGNWALLGMFTGGFGFGLFLMSIKLIMQKTKIDSYKRELEKESVNSDKNSSRVQVLEQKIEVLEKALQNALNK